VPVSRLALLAPFLFLTACAGLPDVYPPPVQRKGVEGSDYAYLGNFIRMNDPNAEAYIVSDVAKSVEGGTWRWTYRRPELRFFLRRSEHLKFAMDFVVADATFQQTGPVVLSIQVNGHPLETVRCARPGERHFEAPVPSGILQPNAINTVAVESDKVWTSPQDGAILGFILIRAGFLE
jgi:hypothetical protein